ncbi:MAG TPA: twin-arginine translocase TatA/TatE family subunit [Nitrososphaeraceae archaeon]|jgi:sec-independent protein translocase protein TatA|nr:twin-arginine translocase TatA/TatE family subunit [Nitrososphaeraceae archaeon]
MGIVNGAEIIIIVVVIAALFFGVKKIPELARSFGKASTEFEKARIEARREIRQLKQNNTTNIDREKLESIADTLGIDYSSKNDEDLRSSIETEINRSKGQA